jgi:HAMP domain-containing protein
VEEACIVDLEGEFCFPLRWPENEKEAFRNAFAALPLDNDVQWYADEQGNLFLCRTIYTLAPYEPQGYLLGRLDVPHLRSLTGMDSMQDGMVTVLDRKGRQLFTGRDETEAPVALFAPDTPKGEWICVQDHDEKVWSLAMTTRRGEWNICFAIPEKDMMARYYRIQKNLFITYGVLIVMGALLALIFSKSMTRNISHLMNSINHIHKSGIKGPVSVEVNGHDEIAELAQKYNWLLSYINSSHQAE